MEEGIRPCSRSGNCCRGRGDCYLTPADTARIADHLDLSVFDFRLSYTHTTRLGTILKVRDGYRGDGSCIFLESDQSCAIQPVKPTQCTDYPLWERFYRDAAAFERARSECAMIGHLSHRAFQRIYALSRSPTTTPAAGGHVGGPDDDPGHER